MRYQLLIALVAAVLFAPLAEVLAQDANDPAIYCREHSNETKCVIFQGGQTPFYSRCGNVGGAGGLKCSTSNRYVVYLHDSNTSAVPARQLAQMLPTKGFDVRGIDHDVDIAGGPGLDYFYQEDKAAATELAAMINASLPSDHVPLIPRFQNVKNPPGTFGVWLKVDPTKKSESR